MFLKAQNQPLWCADTRLVMHAALTVNAADVRFGLETKAGDKRKAEAKAVEPAKKQPSTVCIRLFLQD